MPEVDWTQAIWALAVGLVLGGWLAAVARRSPSEGGDDAAASSGRTRAEARAIRIEDLRQRKNQLIQQIRDLEDTALANGIAWAPAERQELEEEAARVLRELHHLEGSKPPSAGKGAGKKADPGSTTGSPPSQMRGALIGGAVVGFAALLMFTLQQNSAERTGNMPITGGLPPGGETLNAPPPGSGQPGESVQGVPPSMQPKASPRVDAARADVAANPGSVEARVELGWALIEAEGWIDVFNNAAQLNELDPGNPDGLTQQAVVRMKMGMTGPAEELIDQALTAAPTHGRALAWKGSLRWQAGDADGAKAAWGTGAKLYPGEGFDELLKMAEGEPPPAGPGAGAAHPGATGVEATQPATSAAAAGDKTVHGTVSLGEGVQVPQGSTLFVFARPAGQTAGPPLAAVRMPAGTFPMAFSVGPENMPPMMGNRPFPDSLSLAARLDLDGNATTKDGPTGVVSGAVEAGARDVSIVLAP
jgi:hypothetical protein